MEGKVTDAQLKWFKDKAGLNPNMSYEEASKKITEFKEGRAAANGSPKPTTTDGQIVRMNVLTGATNLCIAGKIGIDQRHAVAEGDERWIKRKSM